MPLRYSGIAGHLSTKEAHSPTTLLLFETERLLGRHIDRQDADAMFAVYVDALAMR